MNNIPKPRQKNEFIYRISKECNRYNEISSNLRNLTRRLVCICGHTFNNHAEYDLQDKIELLMTTTKVARCESNLRTDPCVLCNTERLVQCSCKGFIEHVDNPINQAIFKEVMV